MSELGRDKSGGGRLGGGEGDKVVTGEESEARRVGVRQERRGRRE